jgi:hypothetical protein
MVHYRAPFQELLGDPDPDPDPDPGSGAVAHDLTEPVQPVARR